MITFTMLCHMIKLKKHLPYDQTDMQDVCDGIIDCIDGWDESPAICKG